MSDRRERPETVPPEAPPETTAPQAPPPPVSPRRTSRRDRVRRALSSRPQLRDMVIVQEVLLPPVGIRDRKEP